MFNYVHHYLISCTKAKKENTDALQHLQARREPRSNQKRGRDIFPRGFLVEGTGTISYAKFESSIKQ